jgi:hypothetical protein
MVATRTARIRAAARSHLHELVTKYPVIRSVLRPAALRAAISVLTLRGRGRVPSRRVLRWLRYGWANQGYSGSVEYVEEVARQASAARGPIVEAGSGLTSIVLSYVARRDQVVVSLEHIPQWAERVSRFTSRHGAHRVLSRPLTRYDGYDWYAVSAEDLPIDVALAVVDGPPGGTRGGRYGALPQLAARFGSDAVLLLDDADRLSEKQVLARWGHEFGARTEVRKGGSRAFAVIRAAEGKTGIATL